METKNIVGTVLNIEAPRTSILNEVEAWPEKHRPQHFRDQIGLASVTGPLQALLRNRQCYPLLILAGHYGCGKTTTALNYARAFYCDDEDVTNRPCGICESCRNVEAKERMRYLNAGENGSVEDIRGLIEGARYDGTNALMYLIDEAHHLSEAAQTALLDITEKPNQRMTTILVTTDQNKLLETLRSRGMVFEFYPHRQADIVKRLLFIAEAEGMFIRDDTFTPDLPLLDLITEKANGDVRSAIKYLQELYIQFGKTPSYLQALERHSRERDDVVIKLMLLLLNSSATDGTIVLQLLEHSSSITKPSEVANEVIRVLYTAFRYKYGEQSVVDNSYSTSYDQLVALDDDKLISLFHLVKRYRAALGNCYTEMALTLLQINQQLHAK